MRKKVETSGIPDSINWHSHECFFRGEKGVTIAVLIVAIIILIILAGISMSAIVGDNGILDAATEAKISADVSSYNEELSTLEIQNKAEQINNGMSAKEYIDEFKSKVESSTVFEGSEVNKMTSAILRIQTPEGYVFIVTEDGIEYAGINGEFEETYEISEEDFTFTYIPSYWTNEDITVTIKLNFDTESTIQYSLDGEEWIDYEEGGITIETNCIIYARLVDGTATISSEVTNIDKTAPVVEDLTSTTNSVIITATDSSDGTDGVSGIVGYYISTSSSTPSEDDFTDCRDENGDGVTSLEVTVDGLTQETTYYVWVIDDAGNISEVKSIETGSVPDLGDGDVEFTLSEDDWTNEDVIVYVDITDEDIQEKIDDGTYILEYSTDGGETWEEYDPETGITVDENTEIQVRISDGDNTGDPISTEVTNIDKTAPVVEDLTSTTNSVTITATDSSDGTDGVSGIVGYYMSTSRSTPSEDNFTDCRDENGDGVTSLEVTVDGLTQETTYYVWVIDDAGNISEVKSIETETLPSAESNITISYSPTDWTNGDVTIKVSTHTGYNIQYSLDILSWSSSFNSAGSTGSEYNWYTLVVTENSTIYFRLYDGTNATDDYATLLVSNIDKLSPEEFTVSIDKVTTKSITVSGSTVDSEETDEYGESGIDHYEFSLDGGETWTYVGEDENETTYTFTGLTQSTEYTIVMKAVDVAGNETISEEANATTGTVDALVGEDEEVDLSSDYEVQLGDWVSYPIDVNGDGDLTNDWRVFYIDDDGIVFLITADYVRYDCEYLDLEAAGLTSHENDTYMSNYAFTWESTTTKQTINSTTNSLFMANGSLISSGTYTAACCVSTLLNTSNWSGFVDSTYATYAIGSPTLEMWIAAWVDKGYSQIYYAEGSYGYYIGTSSNPTSSYLWITETDIENSGVNDTLFFNSKDITLDDGSWCWGYWMASLGNASSSALQCYSVGEFQTNAVYDDDQNEGGIRPVVSLKSSTELVYNISGYWDVSTGSSSDSNDDTEVATANVLFSYSTTLWTNEDIVITVTLSDEQQAYIDNGTYIIQYAIDNPDDEDSWSSYTSSGIQMSTCGSVYVRLYDGTNGGNYATGNVTNIDKLAPDGLSLEYKEITLQTIYVLADASDQESTSENACSGLSHYEFSIDGGSTWETKEKGVSKNLFANLEKATTYSVAVKAVDNAGNEIILEESVSTENQAETGDWVEYSVDLNGNGDYTDDWRMFYTDDDGNMFIIAADYLDNDSSYFELDDIGLSTRLNYGVYWSTVPSKQWTTLMTSTTNTLFMFNYAYGSSSTNSNMKAVSRLLNTENWDGFVDEDYATYAIGSPTVEMWVDAWNEKGYTDLYLAESSTGYYMGTTSSPTSVKVYVGGSEGYDDNIFFPHQITFGSDGTIANSYWLAGPSANLGNYVMLVSCDGYVWDSNYGVSGGRVSALRPVVSLNSIISAEYNTGTGIWNLSN